MLIGNSIEIDAIADSHKAKAVQCEYKIVKSKNLDHILKNLNKETQGGWFLHETISRNTYDQLSHILKRVKQYKYGN